MAGKSLEQYYNEDPKLLMASIAYYSENLLPKIEKHLDKLNNSVDENTKRSIRNEICVRILLWVTGLLVGFAITGSIFLTA